MTIKEITEKIRNVGPNNYRIVSISQNKVKLEINTPQGWVSILSGVTRQMAEDTIRQATNKVIMG
jgi:hypothetical protein